LNLSTHQNRIAVDRKAHDTNSVSWLPAHQNRIAVDRKAHDTNSVSWLPATCLEHAEEVEEYLAGQERQADDMERTVRSAQKADSLQKRLEERRAHLFR
jgi:hypothetical protein